MKQPVTTIESLLIRARGHHCEAINGLLRGCGNLYRYVVSGVSVRHRQACLSRFARPTSSWAESKSELESLIGAVRPRRLTAHGLEIAVHPKARVSLVAPNDDLRSVFGMPVEHRS